jgi:hypothetical protein
MHFLTRVTLTALATCTLFGLSSGESPGWLDFKDMAALYRRFVGQRQRGEELADQEVRLHSRLRGKERVARDLAQGRLTLTQAAARFRELSAGTPEVQDAIDRVFRSGSEGEKLCRYVILWTERALEESPETARATGERLRAELDELLRSGAPLVAR